MITRPLQKTGRGAHRAVAAGGRRTAIDQLIYESVYDAVMSHRLPPGTKLAEVGLCELFHVSRTVVRKALQRLAHEHIVELRPNRGASVASPSPKETREVFAARRAIEAAIVPLVVEKAGKTEIARLRRHTRSEQKALERGDRSTWIRLTGEFHIVMAEVGGNAVLTSFLSGLVSRCSLIIALYDSPTSVPCATGEHEALIDAIEEGKTARALEMMDHHLLSIEARLALAGEREEVDLAAILVTSMT
jgi:DNA-binding GntR family transcriptional regulator